MVAAIAGFEAVSIVAGAAVERVVTAPAREHIEAVAANQIVGIVARCRCPDVELGSAPLGAAAKTHGGQRTLGRQKPVGDAERCAIGRDQQQVAGVAGHA